MTGSSDSAIGRTHVAAEALSVLGAVGLIAWLPFLTRDGRWPLTLAVGLALAIGTAGPLIDLLTLPARRRAAAGGDELDRDDRAGDRTVATESVTTIVVLGEEPLELARNTIILAREAGPCIVAITGEAPESVAELDVDVVTADRPGQALHDAIDAVTTGAVLLVSGRAAPVGEHTRAAATHLDDERHWAVGRTEPFNHDAFGGDSGGRIGAGLRRRSAGCGLALWEPNATVVDTEALRTALAETPAGRPRGAWLRSMAASGGTGPVVDETVTLVATPVSPRTFWPESLAQQRGAAADAADACRRSRGLPRLLALLLVARESFAWAVPTWLAVLFTGTISGELPFRTIYGAVPALFIAVIALRWFGTHRSLGVPLRPLSDLRSTVDRVPGSLAALPSVLVGKVLPGPRRVSVRPLWWAGVLMVAVLATSLVDHPPDRRMTAPAVVAALLTLVLLWTLCIQVLVQRGWARTSFRLPFALPVRLAGRRGDTVDVSPEGIAVALPPRSRATADVPSIGDQVQVSIDLDDGSTVRTTAQVTWTRRHQIHDGTVHGDDLVGVRLLLEPDDRAAWAAQMVRAASADSRPSTAARSTRRALQHDPASGGRPIGARLLDGLGIGLTVVLSVALLAVLGAAMLGLQVAVVRSGSMTPAIAQGSVVVTEGVPVSELRPGEVITRPSSGGSETLTHRLVSSTVEGGEIRMQTRGDANSTGETWTVPADSTLQRVRWVVPSVGQAVSAARSNVAVVLGAVLALGLVIAAVRLPRNRSGTQHRPAVA